VEVPPRPEWAKKKNREKVSATGGEAKITSQPVSSLGEEETIDSALLLSGALLPRDFKGKKKKKARSQERLVLLAGKERRISTRVLLIMKMYHEGKEKDNFFPGEGRNKHLVRLSAKLHPGREKKRRKVSRSEGQGIR